MDGIKGKLCFQKQCFHFFTFFSPCITWIVGPIKCQNDAGHTQIHNSNWSSLHPEVSNTFIRHFYTFFLNSLKHCHCSQQCPSNTGTLSKPGLRTLNKQSHLPPCFPSTSNVYFPGFLNSTVFAFSSKCFDAPLIAAPSCMWSTTTTVYQC